MWVFPFPSVVGTIAGRFFGALTDVSTSGTLVFNNVMLSRTWRTSFIHWLESSARNSGTWNLPVTALLVVYSLLLQVLSSFRAALQASVSIVLAEISSMTLSVNGPICFPAAPNIFVVQRLKQSVGTKSTRCLIPVSIRVKIETTIWF